MTGYRHTVGSTGYSHRYRPAPTPQEQARLDIEAVQAASQVQPRRAYGDSYGGVQAAGREMQQADFNNALALERNAWARRAALFNEERSRMIDARENRKLDQSYDLGELDREIKWRDLDSKDRYRTGTLDQRGQDETGRNTRADNRLGYQYDALDEKTRQRLDANANLGVAFKGLDEQVGMADATIENLNKTLDEIRRNKRGLVGSEMDETPDGFYVAKPDNLLFTNTVTGKEVGMPGQVPPERARAVADLNSQVAQIYQQMEAAEAAKRNTVWQLNEVWKQLQRNGGALPNLPDRQPVSPAMPTTPTANAGTGRQALRRLSNGGVLRPLGP